ncbi:MAG: hypothetical protein JNL39_01020 [Opitutaceae bacterium]|nr:hypothetical protein [Opitutaceae bacterium]
MTPAPRLMLRVLAFALMLTPAHLPAAQPGPSSPPDYPDALHLPEGCLISTLAYLATFAAEFPGEQRAPFTTLLPHNGQHHTVALVTWAGEWWLRDEFLGVIPLKVSAGSGDHMERATQAAGAVLGREAKRLTLAQRRHIAAAGGGLDATQAVAHAARLLPVPADVYVVTSGGREFPLLFFRPSPGAIAVYDPRHGTAVAETASPHAAAIVREVAQRLGYGVTSVRLDQSRLLASAGLSSL